MIHRIMMQFARVHATVVPQRGYTLIELLVVLVVLGVLAAVATPAYLGMRNRAVDAAVKANIRAARPAAEAFAFDNVGAKGDADNKAKTVGYKGMTMGLLRAGYDAGLSTTLTVVSGKTTETQYCLTDTMRGRTWSLLGPAGSGSDFVNNAKCK